MGRVVEWWDRRQVPLYVAAVLLGALVGSHLPAIAPALTIAINPTLALLLFATFLGVPLIEVGRSFRDVRFLLTVLVVNFLVVPCSGFLGSSPTIGGCSSGCSWCYSPPAWITSSCSPGWPAGHGHGFSRPRRC